MWSTANAMAKYNVTANTIMPSGTTRMIDSTPRGQKVFEETGKWPNQQAIGTERDPDNVAPLVVYLASDAAAQVNGQVFQPFGYGYTLLAQPQAIRRIEADRRIEPEELAHHFPNTMGRKLQEPLGTLFGKTLDQRAPSEWTKHANGVRTRKLPTEPAQSRVSVSDTGRVFLAEDGAAIPAAPSTSSSRESVGPHAVAEGDNSRRPAVRVGRRPKWR